MRTFVGHYVLIDDLSSSEWPRGVLENTKYLGVVQKKLHNKYKIRVIGEVELQDGVYVAADYELQTIVERDIQKVEEIPASTTILCQ